MQNQMDEVDKKRSDSIDKLIEVLPQKEPLQVIREIDELIGMEETKENIATFIRRNILDSKRRAFNLKADKGALHTVLYGNPGVGKTTIAKKMAELFHSLGLVGDKYIEVSRAKIVGQFIGHTEANIEQMMDKANVVFIDEAYNLVDGSATKQDFGYKIIDSLITRLEKDRGNLVVFLAGYREEMDNFLSCNPGFKSRIAYYEDIKDYTIDQLGEMLEKKLKNDDFDIMPDATEEAKEQLAKLKEKQGERVFGNAREVRLMVEQVPNQMAKRLFPDIFNNYSSYSTDDVLQEIESTAHVTKAKSGIYVVEGAVDLTSKVEKDLKTVIREDIKALDIVNKRDTKSSVKKNKMGFE